MRAVALALKQREERADKVALADRYELRGVIGGGRSGLVHRAYDRRSGRVVALKTLRAGGSEALYRLKREFRTLARLAHPNLVSFFDLVVDGDQRFFTMELVEGTDFVDAFRTRLADGEPASAVHADLRAAVRQLAAGLDALHRHGILHRDVKPANVLVAGDGRVVLLDFGLALDVAATDDGASGTAGTMGYLAPEQIAGHEASVASDWFAAGVVLYETLTGRMPFEGAQPRDVASGKAPRPTPPSVFEPATPPDLEALALALLAHDPVRRPVANDVVARLTGEGDARDVEPALPRRALVGRDAQLAVLDDALAQSRAGARAVQVGGPSGIGKTALVERFVQRAAEEQGALVLAARCHPHEAIPFKALDAAIDALARHLSRLGDDAVRQLLPDDVAAVRRIFPVLGRVPRIARAIARHGTDVDPARGRADAFAALREILSRLAARRPLVLWVDDAHCGDLDSAALLVELLRAPAAPRLLLVLSFREEPGLACPMVAALRASAAVQPGERPEQVLQIGPLTAGDAVGLVCSVLGDDAALVAERIVDEAEGSPLFALEIACELAEQRDGERDRAAVADAPPSLAAVIARRVDRLPAPARELVELLAVAGGPLDRDVVRRALATDADPRPALALLHARRLARPVPLGDGIADAVGHDRIAETVLGRLAPDRRRALHLALAGALGSDVDPRLLVHHYEHGGEVRRAAELALVAGRRAAADFAFHQAAELYGRALALGATTVPAWVLHARIGRMLTFAGHAADAAAHFVAAADALAATEPSDARAVGLRRRAAEAYLRSGRYEPGLAALRATLDACDVRCPRSTPGAILSVLARRTVLALRTRLGRHGTPERPGSVSDRERELLELYWSATVGLSLSDVVRGTDFQLRHALLARRTGEPRHLARALCTEAGILVWEGGASRREHAERMLDEADRLATSVGDPEVALLVTSARSTLAFAARRFRESLNHCEAALRMSRERHVGTTWETANLELGVLNALLGMGELGRARVRMLDAQRRAQERGDLYGVVALRLGTAAFAWLGADEPAQVERQIAEARAAAPLPPFHEYCALYAQAQADIYVGDAARAWRTTTAAWPRLRRQLLLRIEGVHLDLLETRARAALALAAQGGPRRAALLRFVRRATRRMVRTRADWILPSVIALRAGVAWQEGDRTSAIAGLAAAAAAFDRRDMRMHAAAARLHLARLGVGEPVERCADAMRALGAVRPGRLAAALLPGFPELDR